MRTAPRNPSTIVRVSSSGARFWQHSDSLHAAYRKDWPIEAGLFDYGRYENR